jgi:hypothetical protein
MTKEDITDHVLWHKQYKEVLSRHTEAEKLTAKEAVYYNNYNLDKCTVGGYDKLHAWMLESKSSRMEKWVTTMHGYMEYTQWFEREDGTYRIDWLHDPCGGKDSQGETTLLEGPIKQ